MCYSPLRKHLHQVFSKPDIRIYKHQRATDFPRMHMFLKKQKALNISKNKHTKDNKKYTKTQFPQQGFSGKREFPTRAHHNHKPLVGSLWNIVGSRVILWDLVHKNKFCPPRFKILWDIVGSGGILWDHSGISGGYCGILWDHSDIQVDGSCFRMVLESLGASSITVEVSTNIE